jgi:glutamate-1-semialdehyde 2,1-aminomutase
MDPKGWRDETVKQFDRSIRAFQRAQAHLAGGVSSIMRAAARPVPLFFRSGSGAVLVVLDGHRYIDYAMGWGAIDFGPLASCCPPCLPLPAPEISAPGRPAQIGSSGSSKNLPNGAFGRGCGLLEYRIGGRPVGPPFGTRLDRKAEVRKIRGHYDGWIDNVLLSYHSPRDVESKGKAVPGSEGQSFSGLEDVCILPWNDLNALERAVGEQSDYIAAIITEPILCNSSCLMPCGDYPQKMRQVADRFGIVLIFDKVITGFRVARGAPKRSSESSRT